MRRRFLAPHTLASSTGEASRAHTPGHICHVMESHMLRISQIVRRFVRDEEGAAAIEYGLIAGGIAVGIIAAVVLIGGQLSTIFTNIQTQLATVL